MAQSKKSKKSGRNLQKSKKVEAVKPLLFANCCSGTHISTGTMLVR